MLIHISTPITVHIKLWSSWVHCCHFLTWKVSQWLRFHFHRTCGQLFFSIAGRGDLNHQFLEHSSWNLVRSQFMIETIRDFHFVRPSVKKWVHVIWNYSLSVETLPTNLLLFRAVGSLKHLEVELQRQCIHHRSPHSHPSGSRICNQFWGN